MASDSQDEGFYTIRRRGSDSGSDSDSDSDYNPEDVIEPSMQMGNKVLHELRKSRWERAQRTGKPPMIQRLPIFCKKGLTALHDNLAREYATQVPPFSIPAVPAPILLTDDPDLLNLRPISRPELLPKTRHTGRIIFGTLCVEPIVIESQLSVLEEPNNPGAAVRVAIYNSVGMYPPGTKVAIKNPHYENRFIGICVYEPRRDLVEVSSFPLALELEGMKALRARGNHCFRRCAWVKAAGLYTRCIDKRPADAALSEVQECLLPAYSNRAAAYLKMGEWEKALGDAEAALAMDEWHTKCLYRKGRALEELGRYGEAAEWLEKIKEEALSVSDVQEIAKALERVKIKA